MHIKLPNGVIIEDASEELVRSILGASFSPVVTKVEVNPVATAPSEASESAEPVPAADAGRRIHPLNKHRVPADGFDPLPPVVSTITGSHRIMKTEMFLILSELNRAGRDLRPKEIHDRLTRYEVFSTLKMAAVYHGLAILVKYGAVIHEERTYRIGPEISGSSEHDLVALIDLHDTPAEWAQYKRWEGRHDGQ